MYCFGKIIDSLRIRAVCENVYTLPSCICIQDTHQEHFEKIVDYLFPGEYASFILQGSEINSMIFSKHQSSQIGSWLSDDGVSGVLELLYWGSRDGWKTLDFHAKCYDKCATITVIQGTGGFIFGGFSDKPWTSIHSY